MYKHGLSRTKIYKTWHGMIRRCYDPRDKAFARYGGKGITVSEQWLLLENFVRDMNDSLIEHVALHGAKNTSLDRIENNKGYSKENCRWATQEIQQNNRSDNKILTFNGMTGTLTQMCKNHNIKIEAAQGRLKKGSELKDVFERPVTKRHPNLNQQEARAYAVQIGKKFAESNFTVKEATEVFGFGRTMILRLIHKVLPKEDLDLYRKVSEQLKRNLIQKGRYGSPAV